MRTDSTLGVIFFTRKKRNDPERLEIYVRITVNKERGEFNIKRDISVCNWDIFRCRAKETDHNLILLNTYLDDVYAEVLNAHKQLHSERKLITAKAIKQIKSYTLEKSFIVLVCNIPSTVTYHI
ncbi:MAG: hypothetical protein GY931_02065 [Maribacter sp.]|nr:hypothetical protein [Maribacter sp.]